MGTSPVRNFDDEVLSQGDPLSLSQFDNPEEEDGEELFGVNLERYEFYTHLLHIVIKNLHIYALQLFLF